MASLQTVLGLLPTSGLGMILPHEHLFTDLRGPDTKGYAEANIQHVIRRLRPYLADLKELRVAALVEASTCGVGRNIQVLRAVAEALDFPVVAPTGAYRDAFIPAHLRSWPLERLRDWMVGEICEDGIEGTGIRAGFIKLAASDEGLTPLEERLLRAAAQAALQTGAAVASHTTVGATAVRQLAILEEEGLDPRRFIWVHAHCEPDLELHLRLARREAYLEYDAIGSPDLLDSFFVGLIRRLWEANCGAQVLLSQDAGWYQPGEPEAPIRSYSYLPRRFVPALRQAGFGAPEIEAMVVQNPLDAFALAV